MAVGGIAKIFTWAIRLFQLLFAIILVGILSYMIHEFHRFGYDSPSEVIVPQVFSVLAIIVCFFSIMAVCFLGYALQLVAAFFDFVLWVGYLASAGLLRHNYHVHSYKNPLRNTLISFRVVNNREHRTSGLVKLLVALVTLQIFLFFITTLLSVFVARRHGEERTTREKPRHTAVV